MIHERDHNSLPQTDEIFQNEVDPSMWDETTLKKSFFAWLEATEENADTDQWLKDDQKNRVFDFIKKLWTPKTIDELAVVAKQVDTAKAYQGQGTYEELIRRQFEREQNSPVATRKTTLKTVNDLKNMVAASIFPLDFPDPHDYLAGTRGTTFIRKLVTWKPPKPNTPSLNPKYL